MSGAEPAGAGAEGDTPSENVQFGEKVEEVLDGIINYIKQVMDTFALLLFRPWRAPPLLRRETRGRHTPPLGFLVTGYLFATLAGLLAADLYSALYRSDSAFGAFFEGAQKQLEGVDVAPLKLILLAFPILVTLLLIGRLAAAVLRLDHTVVIALCAYSTACAWYFTPIMVLAFLGALGISLAIQNAGAAFILYLLAILVLLLTTLGGIVFWLLQVFTLAAAVANRRNRLRRAATFFGLAAAAVASCVVETRLLAAALGKKLASPPIEVTARLRSVEFRGLDSGVYYLSDPQAPKSPLLLDHFKSATPELDTSCDSPDIVHSGDQTAILLSLIVVLQNRSDTTLLIERVSMRSGANSLALRLPKYENGKLLMICNKSVDMGIAEWSDKESPVLVLRRGDVKWIRLSGQVSGFSSARQLNRFELQASLVVDGIRLETPWQSIWAQPSANQRAPDSLRSSEDRLPK